MSFPRTALQDVGIALAQQLVVAGAAEQRIGAVSCSQEVIACTAVELVGELVAAKLIVQCVADTVDARAEQEQVLDVGAERETGEA